MDRFASAFLVAVVASAVASGGPALGTTPVRFEPNLGQASPDVAYVGTAPGSSVLLGSDGRAAICARGGTAVVMSFAGAAPVGVRGEGELSGVSSYLRGAPERWVERVPGVARVRFEQAFPGVDVVYHGDRGALELDVVVSPDASRRPLADLTLAIEGARGLCIDARGNLVVDAPWGELLQGRPVAHQPPEGSEPAAVVEARWVVRGPGLAAIEVGPHDPGRTLVIDPVIVSSSYLGGSGNDAGYGIALDAAGHAYVVGSTTSTDFPVVSPFQGGCASCGSGEPDAFVAKIDPTGRNVLFATYLGGSGADEALGIAVDRSGNPHVVGYTASDDFPTRFPLQGARGGSSDGFLAILDAAGALQAGTYLGGSSADGAHGVAVAFVGGAISIAGLTSSADFPVVNALQPAFGGATDAFVTKLDRFAAGWQFSTYLGGAGSEGASSIALGPQRELWVGGPGGYGSGRGHLWKLDSLGTAILLETDTGTDRVASVAVDAAGNCYSSGLEWLPDWRFLSIGLEKRDPAGTLLWSTSLGGGPGASTSLALDAAGNAYVTGWDDYYGGTTSCLSEPYLGDGGADDAIVAKVDPTGRVLPMSTPLGGQREEMGYGIAVDPAGVVWVTGSTPSTDFPVVDPFQASPGGSYPTTDAFVTRIAESPPLGPPVAHFRVSNADGPPPLAASFRDASYCQVDTVLWDFGDGATSTARDTAHTYVAEGFYTVSLTATNVMGSDTETRIDVVRAYHPIQVDFTGAPTEGILPLTVAFSNLTVGNVASWDWSFGDGTRSAVASPTHTYTTPGTYSVCLWATGPYTTGSDCETDYVLAHEVIPGFHGTPRIGRPPLLVQLTNQTQGNAVGYQWSFGDGATSTAVSPLHTYHAPGRYTVGLRADGPTTSETATKPDYLLVSVAPPASLLTGPGPDPAAAPWARGFDALGTPSAATSVYAYGTLGYGVNVASGSTDGVGLDEVLTGPGPGAVFGPQVRGFTAFSAPVPRINFYAYGTLRYGTLVDAAALDPDAADEILTGAPPGAVFGPHVRGCNDGGTAVAPLPGLSFFAYGTLRHGVNVASGRVDGATLQEILTAPGPGPAFAPLIRAFRYQGSVSPLAKVNFVAWSGLGYGARVDGAALDGDAADEMLAGPGPGAGYGAGVGGFDYDGTAVRAMPGVQFFAFATGTYGSEPHGGDLDGDTEGEILVGRGPDPAGAAQLRGFDLVPTVVPIGSLDVVAYGSFHGVHAVTGRLGF